MGYVELLGEYIKNIDSYILVVSNLYGIWIYLIIFIIIFLETGMFMAVILPEESLLFVLGTLSAQNIIDIRMILFIILLATVIGDTTAYMLGRTVGNNVEKKYQWFNKKYVQKAKEFYKDKGDRAIIFSRLIPIVRTFVPFAVGISGLKYSRFIVLNMLGAVPWIFIFTLAGYWFGNIQKVKENIVLGILVIILISLIPIIIKYYKVKNAKDIQGQV